MSITDDLLTLLMGKVNGEGGGDKPLTPLTNPALAENILAGKEAYNDQKEVLTGSLTVADLLAALTNPAAVGDLLAGKEAYNDQGVKLVGSLTVADLLAALNTPASAGDIAAGKEAYDDQGQRIVGTASAGGSVLKKDVNFYCGITGDRLFSYTISEFNDLTDLPTPPAPPVADVVFNGWWLKAAARASLSDIKSWGRKINVYADYKLNRAKTSVIGVYFPEDTTVNISFKPSEDVTLDYGDGSSEPFIGDGSSVTVQHSYTAGSYNITISGGAHVLESPVCASTRANTDTNVKGTYIHYVACGDQAGALYLDGQINLRWTVGVGASVSKCVSLEGCCGRFDNTTGCSRMLHAPSSNTTNMTSLEEIYGEYSSVQGVPTGLLDVDAHFSSSIPSFANCMKLVEANVTCASNVVTMGSFQKCYSLEKISIPDSITTIPASGFANCALKKVTIPENVVNIYANAFSSCLALKEIHFKPATPPTLAASTAFYNLPTDCVIYVPRGSLEAYTTATNYPSSSTYTYVEED